MNKRIEELERQCWDYQTNHLNAKKFAELIIKECANQCDLLLNHKMSTEWARGTHDCSKAIREYFGIKE